MNVKLYYKTTATIFLIVAVLHLARIFNGWEAQIGEFMVPMWMSWVAVAIAGYLSYRGFTTKKAR
jgi:hypothetical protein